MHRGGLVAELQGPDIAQPAGRGSSVGREGAERGPAPRPPAGGGRAPPAPRLAPRARPPALAHRQPSAWRRVLASFGLLPVLTITLVVGVYLYEPRFLNQLNVFNVLRNSAFLMIAAAGQMLVLIVGGFDLSVGAVAALASVTTAMTMAKVLQAGPDAAGPPRPARNFGGPRRRAPVGPPHRPLGAFPPLLAVP